ncbi:LuxR C-terminal-related transcriptional regulator [Chloroflexota bacterium]
MTSSILVTKLFIPPTRPEFVPRPGLIKQLNEGLHRKLTLISAPAGFGKTTLVSEWIYTLRYDGPKENQIVYKAAWLSLDGGDNDPTRFLAYLVAALQSVVSNIGEGVLVMLQSPKLPPAETLLIPLINEIAAIPDRILLVLDDYHVIDAQPVHDALSFLLENMPPQMHLVIATREDPDLPLSRFLARGQLTELRAADLRFSSSEAAEFLNQVMGLNLSTEDIAALENRTEGWIAGLQLAAISMKRGDDATSFIKSFTGSDRLVLDYLIEEVLEQQSQNVQAFLLQTAILDRLTGSLCDAVRFGFSKSPSSSERATLTGRKSGREILEYLEHANLFIVPLDNERRWYRYHHLFAELLRQRLHQREGEGINKLHIRASEWYEHNGLEIEAFYHAAAANDIARAERLIEGDGLPIHWLGAASPVLNWLASLPKTELDARPSLWVTYASVLVFAGQSGGVEQKLQAAEAAIAEAADVKAAPGGLQNIIEPEAKPQDLIGRIAALRAMMAVPLHQVESIITQSRLALEQLHSDNLTYRTAANWTLGYAYEIQGDRIAASQAYSEVISRTKASGNFMFTLAATTSLGNIQEAENQLHLAAETQRAALQLAGDPPVPFACASYLSLARILYEWNELDAAEQHAQKSAQLAQQIEGVDTPAACWLFLCRLKLAQGDVAEAAFMLAQADQFMQQHNFGHLLPEIAAASVLISLNQGNLAKAADLAEKHELPLSQARVHLAQGDPGEALALLEPLRRQVEAKGLVDERLKVMVLLAVALYAHGEKEGAVGLLGEVLALAEPGSFIRTFVDEGPPMARVLYEILSHRIKPDYVRRLLVAFPDSESGQTNPSKIQAPKSELFEPLSEREIEVLELISEGLTNQEIATRLFLSQHTVKVHAHNIYGKLGVKNRTEAVAKGKSLGILTPT